MKQDEARKLVLETLEVIKAAQLRAIQELKGKILETAQPPRRQTVGRRIGQDRGVVEAQKDPTQKESQEKG